MSYVNEFGRRESDPLSWCNPEVNPRRISAMIFGWYWFWSGYFAYVKWWH